MVVWFPNPLAAGSDFFQVRWGPCVEGGNVGLPIEGNYVKVDNEAASMDEGWAVVGSRE